MELYDVIVVGGGHAGCEAAVAASSHKLKVLLITMSMDRLAWMSCNPAIGGLAKGHLVQGTGCSRRFDAKSDRCGGDTI